MTARLPHCHLHLHIRFHSWRHTKLIRELKGFLLAWTKRYFSSILQPLGFVEPYNTFLNFEPPSQITKTIMDTNNPKPTPLGTLAKLPTELRLDIFKRILAQDFKQVYKITESGFVYCPEQSSPKPRYFNISRQVCDEMMAARSNHRRVSIGLRTITTDFIANVNVNDTTSILAANELTASTMLEVTIVRPSPRSATGFAQLRSNVHDFVDLLSSSTSMIPKLAVRLGYSHRVDRGVCGYNDFAVLMGPFYRLRAKPCRGIMMYRTTGKLLWITFATTDILRSERAAAHSTAQE